MITSKQVEERLRSRRSLSAAAISAVLEKHRQQICRELCTGETCDRCKLHKSESCRLTPVLNAISDLGKEIMEE